MLKTVIDCANFASSLAVIALYVSRYFGYTFEGHDTVLGVALIVFFATCVAQMGETIWRKSSNPTELRDYMRLMAIVCGLVFVSIAVIYAAAGWPMDGAFWSMSAVFFAVVIAWVGTIRWAARKRGV